MSHAETSAQADSSVPQRLDAKHLERALEALRDVSYAVVSTDEGQGAWRCWRR